MTQALAAIPRIGRIALVDLVRCPTHEARVAYATLARDLAARFGGALVWAGSIDQQLVGRGLEQFEDVLISEFPTGEACLHALAERRAWQPESFVDEIATWGARPWPRWQRLGVRALFAALRLRGGGPTPLAGELPEDDLDELARGGVDPEPDQLRALADAGREDRVVMVNFLRHRERVDEASGASGSGKAAYAAYGRITASLVGRMGGSIRYLARTMRVIQGDPEAPWDALALVEYPSRAAFLGMVRDARYREGTPLRRAGLDSTRLLVCTGHAAFH